MPELDDMGALDFSNIDTLIALGEKAAREMLPQIRALKKDRKSGSVFTTKENLLKFLLKLISLQLNLKETKRVSRLSFV